MDENNLDTVTQDDHGMRDDNNLLSDVIEVIATDPDFRESTAQQNSKMFNGGGEIPAPQLQPSNQQSVQQSRRQAHVRIIEQPASKALRFRYECEGRSAGSIPGASSSPENKTFPTIQIVGYQGRAVVVVSCVTKDPPHRPHPHNIVGREGCKNGIYKINIVCDTLSTVQFTNVGVQCVKRKKVTASLKMRELLNVDPFMTGFGHRNQPTSIDLNAVRLCFQVFLEGDKPGKFSVPLTPVVSEPIYDKKAMSDLSIIKLSDCVSFVDGGRKDIILLCEKVAKEDIQVRFYEETGDWEAFADFQPSQVHKQHAIWFRTPKYKTLEVTEPVKVFIQLRRPSDGAASEPLPFELLPLDSGRPPYWSFRRNFGKKANYNLFNSILANDAKIVAKRQLGNVPEVNEPEQVADKPVVTSSWGDSLQDSLVVSSTTDVGTPWSENMETNNNQSNIENKEMDYSEIKKLSRDDSILANNNNKLEEKSFNELINQVAELDEIYSDTQARLLNDTLKDINKPSLQNLPDNESFDDSKTYSSLQLALKNPIEFDYMKYDEVPLKPPSPLVSASNKRENESEKLPPLPPKRTKKIETYIGGSMSSIQLAGKPLENTLHRSNSSLRTAPVSRSHSFNLQRPKSQSELVPPGKRLPPTPNCSTLPNPKKRGFFSKLFGRKSKTPGTSRETSVTPSTKSNIFSSTKSLQVDNNLAKSASNISTHSANSIRIPLKDSPPNSPQNLPALSPAFSNKNVIDITRDDIDMHLDLTEAEHYALYTAMAPHATQSEFDEMSCYYAPVEGGKLLTNAEVLERLASKT